MKLSVFIISWAFFSSLPCFSKIVDKFPCDLTEAKVENLPVIHLVGESHNCKVCYARKQNFKASMEQGKIWYAAESIPYGQVINGKMGYEDSLVFGLNGLFKLRRDIMGFSVGAIGALTPEEMLISFNTLPAEMGFNPHFPKIWEKVLASDDFKKLRAEKKGGPIAAWLAELVQTKDTAKLVTRFQAEVTDQGQPEDYQRFINIILEGYLDYLETLKFEEDYAIKAADLKELRTNLREKNTLDRHTLEEMVAFDDKYLLAWRDTHMVSGIAKLYCDGVVKMKQAKKVIVVSVGCDHVPGIYAGVEALRNKTMRGDKVHLIVDGELLKHRRDIENFADRRNEAQYQSVQRAKTFIEKMSR